MKIAFTSKQKGSTGARHTYRKFGCKKSSCALSIADVHNSQRRGGTQYCSIALGIISLFNSWPTMQMPRVGWLESTQSESSFSSLTRSSSQWNRYEQQEKQRVGRTFGTRKLTSQSRSKDDNAPEPLKTCFPEQRLLSVGQETSLSEHESESERWMSSLTCQTFSPKIQATSHLCRSVSSGRCRLGQLVNDPSYLCLLAQTYIVQYYHALKIIT